MKDIVVYHRYLCNGELILLNTDGTAHTITELFVACLEIRF